MDYWTTDTTFSVTAGLTTPDIDAEMSVVPADTPVAKPVDDMVALLVSELLHVTLEVISDVEPSE